MAIYYVRQTGNDANSGLSPALAWRTLNKALGAAGIADTTVANTVYIGAGVYRETVTVGMTNATAEQSFIGDVDGSKTGDAGEIQMTSYIINDRSLPSTTIVMDLSGRDFLTFKNIIFISMVTSSSNGVIAANTSTDIKFLKCCFFGTANTVSGGINITVNFGVSANWLIDSCIFIISSSSSNRPAINVALTTGNGNDYNANIRIKNCLHIGGCFVAVSSIGSSNQEGGGVIIENCNIMGMSTATFPIISTVTNRVGGSNFKYPVQVFNCYIFGGSTGVNASELGNIIENHNIIHTITPRSNVLIGQNTISNTSMSPLLEFGQSFLYNLKPRPFGIPLKNSPLLCHGGRSIGPTTDIFDNIRPKGAIHLLHQGIATTGTINTLTDTTKSFGTSGSLVGYTIKVLNGPGAGETKTINASTNTDITIDGRWINVPSSGTQSKYAIFQGPTSMNSLVSTGTVTTLTDNYANWGTNFWQGYTMMVTSGVASGQNFMISGNDATTLTGYYPLSTIPGSGDVYELFWGAMLKGVVSTGTAYTMTDNLAQWPVGTTWPSGYFWASAPWRVMIYEGVASGQNFCISGNTPTTFSGWNALSPIPASGDKYVVFQSTGDLTGYYPSDYYPPYSREYIQTTVGCYSITDTAIRETGITYSSPNSIKLFGPACQDFQIPLASGITTINVRGYYDEFYSGTLPQIILKNGTGIGVADNTGTMVGNSNQWELISLSFTGTSNGILTVRLQSNCTGIGGSAYFDNLTIN